MQQKVRHYFRRITYGPEVNGYCPWKGMCFNIVLKSTFRTCKLSLIFGGFPQKILYAFLVLTTTDKRTHQTLNMCPAHRIVLGLIIIITCGVQHTLGCRSMCMFCDPHLTFFLYVLKVLISVLFSKFSVCVLPSLREITLLEHRIVGNLC